MNIHVKLTIEKDYTYNMNEWLDFEPDLTKEQFLQNISKWISEDFDRIVSRAGNVIGNFDYNLEINDANE